MAIIYNKEKRIFSLHTEHTTYQMMADAHDYLLHLYYGKRLDSEMDYILTYYDRGFSGNPYDLGNDRTYSMDALPQEFPVLGTGDYRTTAGKIREANGCMALDLRYTGYQLQDGKYDLPGLPAAHSEAAQTLCIYLKDERVGVEVTLLYGVLPDCDVITRSVKVTNVGRNEIYLEKLSSACLDLLYGDYDVLTFYGRHAMERNMQRTPVTHGRQVIGSNRGTSGHQYNPYMILAEHGTTETAGACYGVSLVYSGSFEGSVELDQFDQIRLVMGLQEDFFSYQLKPAQTFYAPEAVLSYSAYGMEQLSNQMHHLVREHICRGKYKDQIRPVLVNSWEACYFDFNGEAIVNLAEQAAALGVELLVMDDGWFGTRDDDNSSLGDWIVNEDKLGCSLTELTKRVHDKGVQFGIWIEPEMVSENSDLYREHPEWAIQVPGKHPVHGRNQLVLDFANPTVVDHIYEQIAAVLRQGDINYVKWDMNRSLCDIYSGSMVWQGNVMYDYMLGVYDLLERLTQAFPDMLWEGCSGGGGRFDMGMLYYTPQIWCSDNTDAVDRIRIQYGTSFAYPLSTMGAHVSAVPNHQTGRVTDMNTRGVVAMTGAFGYELDLGKLSEEDKTAVREQIKTYHEAAPVILKGDYYRLSNPFEAEYGAWMSVDEGKKHAVVGAVLLNTHGNHPVFYIRLRGLAPERSYRDKKTGVVYSGAALMELGMPITIVSGNYPSYQILLDAVE